MIGVVDRIGGERKVGREDEVDDNCVEESPAESLREVLVVTVSVTKEVMSLHDSIRARWESAMALMIGVRLATARRVRIVRDMFKLVASFLSV